MTQYLFKPKRYGYGATPVSWEGWLLVLFHVAVVAGTMVALALGGITPGRLTLGGIVVVLVSALVVWVSVLKTEGSWAWRWGANGKS